MRTDTLQHQLRFWLKNNWDWHPKGKLTADMVWKHKRGRSAGVRYLPETVGRALRLLEEASIIAVKEDGISVQYKWLPHEKRPSYIPFSKRADKSKLFKK